MGLRLAFVILLGYRIRPIDAMDNTGVVTDILVALGIGDDDSVKFAVAAQRREGETT